MSETAPTVQSKAGAQHARAREQLRALQQQAAAQRARDAHDRNVAAERYAVAMLPRTDAPLVPLSDARRDAFLHGLAREIATARDAMATEGTREPVRETTVEPRASVERETLVVTAACTACRGACCSGGGDHAFLRAPFLAERLAAETMTETALAEQYASYLPTEVIDGGCVFQAATGCTLPRDIRAPICNRYQCRGLTSAIADVETRIRETGGSPPEGPAGLYVLYRRGTELSPGAFVPLPLT